MGEEKILGNLSAIFEACQTAREGTVSIELHEGSVVMPDSSHYDETCRLLLTEAMRYHRDVLQLEPAPWNSVSIRTVTDYARAHQLSVRFYGQDAPHGLGYAISAGARRLGLGTAVPCPLPEDLGRILDHEFGHICDSALWKRFSPDLETVFWKERMTPAEVQQVYEAFLKVLTFGGLERKRRRVSQQAHDLFFGKSHKAQGEQVQQANKLLAEIVRYGEEIYDERWRRYMLTGRMPLLFRKGDQRRHEDYEHMKSERTDRTSSYLGSVVIAAALQEAGLWESFSQRNDFDPHIAEILDPVHIQFCRSLIRASSRFFPFVLPSDNPD